MPYKLTNLPKAQKSLEDDVQCDYENGVYTLHAGGWRICTMHAQTPDGMARDIAAAIRTARDRGFEHGREHVRKALGVK